MASTRKALRRLKARALRFDKGHRPIVIFGLRRGGSTMVADAVSASPGVWYANEPFAVFANRPGYATRKAMLPAAEHSHFFALEGGDLDRFATYAEALLSVRLRAMGTCRSTRFPLRADRVCLKVLNAPWMLEWFARHTDAHVLPVLRHPGAQAVSALRQGWDFAVRAYAKRPEALEAWFTPAQIDLIRPCHDMEPGWDLALLDWIVTSAPLRAAASQGHRLWTYEEIVSNPQSFVTEALVGTCGLGPAERLTETFTRPSGSRRMSESEANAMIAEGRTEALLNRWRQKVDAPMLARGQALLDQFGVTSHRFPA